MAVPLEVYKCEQCGNIVEIMHGGAGALVCCGMEMKRFEAGKVDAALEKHVPVLNKTSDGYDVVVGSVAHPMEDKHYIEWIEIIEGDNVYRQYLKPAQEPRATFKTKGGKVLAREYCNLHGLWEKEA